MNLAKKTTVCVHFNSQQGCRYGDSCFYSHCHKENKDISVLNSSPLYKPNPPRSFQHDTQVNSYLHSDNSHINSLWKFDNPDSTLSSENGVYFYGAPGTFDSQNSKECGNVSISYSQVLSRNIKEDDFQVTRVEQSTTLPQRKPVICSFYAAGSCKFGSYCRNIHSDENKFNDDTIAKDCTSIVECGICMESKHSTYGILSHCDCKFCLPCIREWRKEGLVVAKKADQVRLCPLCRTQSYFIIPSSVHIIGEEKDKLVQVYKDNLKSKVCKYYAVGDCPFGTSCFYMHEEDGRKGVTRVLYKSEDEILTKNQLKFGDFLL